MTGGQICNKSFLAVPVDEPGYEASRLMTLNNAAMLIIVDEKGVPVGYVSRGDLFRAQKSKIVDDTIVDKGLLRKYIDKWLS